jgi:hypothetical protein
MSDTLQNPGGRANWTTYQQVKAERLNNIGDMALQSLTHILAWLFRDQVADAPQSGFPKADDCKVTAAGLVLSIAKGIGFYYDSAETEAFQPHYKPIVVSSATNTTLDAHDATNPRIDIVCLAPATDTDEAASCFLKTAGTVTTTAIDTRQRWTHTLQVVKGTPAATPSAPATPSGYLKIAEVLVPAVSGAVTVTDTRPILTFGHAWSADPAAEYVDSDGFVPGTGNELVVSATSPASLNVRVAAGEVVCNGAQGTKRYRYNATTLAVSAAHATLARVDLVVADDDGTLKVVAGTPAGSPVAPSPGAGQVPLAQFVVAALASSIANGDITDLREREPFGPSQLRAAAVTTPKLANQAVTTSKIDDQAVTTAKIADDAVETGQIADGAVTGVKLSVLPVVPDVEISNSGTTATVSITMLDVDGNPVARAQRVQVECINAASSDLQDGGAGTLLHGSTTNKVVGTTDNTGALVLTHVNWGAVGTNLMFIVTPLHTQGGPIQPGYPTFASYVTV